MQGENILMYRMVSKDIGTDIDCRRDGYNNPGIKRGSDQGLAQLDAIKVNLTGHWDIDEYNRIDCLTLIRTLAG